jgi:hypothetical protein
MVIDSESMFTYPSTEDSLRQICGVNTGAFPKLVVCLQNAYFLLKAIFCLLNVLPILLNSI